MYNETRERGAKVTFYERRGIFVGILGLLRLRIEGKEDVLNWLGDTCLGFTEKTLLQNIGEKSSLCDIRGMSDLPGEGLEPIAR